MLVKHVPVKNALKIPLHFPTALPHHVRNVPTCHTRGWCINAGANTVRGCMQTAAAGRCGGKSKRHVCAARLLYTEMGIRRVYNPARTTVRRGFDNNMLLLLLLDTTCVDNMVRIQRNPGKASVKRDCEGLC